MAAQDRVALEAALLERYARFSLYNSPYAAHDRGCAVDLYGAESLGGVRGAVARSPVSGEVLEVRTVRAPPKPYAPAHDHLLAIDVEEPAAAAGLVARILHVEPAVEVGDRVAVGDSLGTLVRSGFFAPWVDDHLHVGFRRPDQNHRRASGSLPLALGADVEIRPLEWDGAGTVRETGDTYALLDAPVHPDPGGAFVGIAVEGGGVLDGGLPHYDGGGLLSRRGRLETGGRPEGGEAAGDDSSEDSPDPISLLGVPIGRATGRHVTWEDVTVTANGEPVTGLSLFLARDAGFGAKLVCPDREFAVGDRLEVSIRLESGSDARRSSS